MAETKIVGLYDIPYVPIVETTVSDETFAGIPGSIPNQNLVQGIDQPQVQTQAIDRRISLEIGSRTSYILIDGNNKRIETSNYVATSVGWQIRGDGSAEFNDVTVRGTIVATAGRIANWYINTDTLSTDSNEANSNVLIDSAGALIRLGATSGDYLTLDGANQRIRTSNYASGALGAGFTLEPDLLEVGNIRARGRIVTANFVKNNISAIGGDLLTVKGSDTLSADMTALDASTLTIEGDITLAVGDFIRIKAGVDDEWLEVANAASAPTYTVTRDKAGSYGADANPIWTKGAVVVNYGQSGDGGVLITAQDTNAPFVQVFTHAGSPWSAITTRARLGNLNGYLGYASDIYGLGVGSSSGTDANITLDPTNGFRVRKGTTDVFTVDNAGSAVMTSANVRSSASGARVELFPDANTGIKATDSSGNTVFEAVIGGADVGDVIMGDESTGQYAKWDESAQQFIVNDSLIANQNVFGDGSDGDVTISSNTTITSDMYYDNLTIDSGFTLNTGGFRIFVKNTLTNNGTIKRTPNAGGNGGNGADGEDADGPQAAGGSAGSAASALASGSLPGTIAGTVGTVGAVGSGNGNNDGDNGAAATAGASLAKSVSSAAVAGSAGGDGGDGGDGTAGSPNNGSSGGTGSSGGAAGAQTGTVFNTIHNAYHAVRFHDDLPSLTQLGASPAPGGAGGAAGGGSGGGGSNAGAGGAGGGSGGSGTPGGVVGVYAHIIVNSATGVIRANGGDGGDGGTGGDGGDGNDLGFSVGGGGGGAGGAGGSSGTGGVLILVFSKLTDSGTIEAAAGAGGTGGTGGSGGSGRDTGTPGTAGDNGNTGNAGNAGVVIQLQI